MMLAREPVEGERLLNLLLDPPDEFRIAGFPFGDPIGISGPSPRMTDDRVRGWEIAIRDEAAVLSRRFGFDETSAERLLV